MRASEERYRRYDQTWRYCIIDCRYVQGSDLLGGGDKRAAEQTQDQLRGAALREDKYRRLLQT